MSVYYRRFISEDEKTWVSVVRVWSFWEMAIFRIFIDDEMLKKVEEDKWVLQFVRVEW